MFQIYGSTFVIRVSLFCPANFCKISTDQIEYIHNFTGCGGVYNDLVGSLQSPGHPSPYPHGAECTYIIAVDPAYIISFQFISFAMQEPNATNFCMDYVEIFDGPSRTSPSLGR